MRTFLLTLACFFASNLTAATKELMVYIGTYTRAEEQGIHWGKLNLETGKLTLVGKLAGQKNPSFLAIHPNKKFLYAVNEIGNFKGQKAGGVSAYAIDGPAEPPPNLAADPEPTTEAPAQPAAIPAAETPSETPPEATAEPAVETPAEPVPPAPATAEA